MRKIMTQTFTLLIFVALHSYGAQASGSWECGSRLVPGARTVRIKDTETPTSLATYLQYLFGAETGTVNNGMAVLEFMGQRNLLSKVIVVDASQLSQKVGGLPGDNQAKPYYYEVERDVNGKVVYIKKEIETSADGAVSFRSEVIESTSAVARRLAGSLSSYFQRLESATGGGGAAGSGDKHAGGTAVRTQ